MNLGPLHDLYLYDNKLCARRSQSARWGEGLPSAAARATLFDAAERKPTSPGSLPLGRREETRPARPAPARRPDVSVHAVRGSGLAGNPSTALRSTAVAGRRGPRDRALDMRYHRRSLRERGRRNLTGQAFEQRHPAAHLLHQTTTSALSDRPYAIVCIRHVTGCLAERASTAQTTWHAASSAKTGV